MNSAFQSSGADRIGRFCALSHSRPELRDTAPFIADAQNDVRRTARRLGEIANFCNGDGHFLADLRESLLHDADALPANLPEKLPFLPVPRPLGNRPRIVILMREWLLMAPTVRHEDHLEEFLSAYQELFPLDLPEIRILPIAFRIALAERCQFLPSVTAHEHDHVALLPVLLRRIHRHLEFSQQTDWKRLGENISKIHQLLSRDPGEIYPKMDFLSRDAYRHEVEEIASAADASESSIAARAIALADRYRQSKPETAHVGYFLLGPGRATLLGAFHSGTRPKHRFHTPAAPAEKRPPLRLDFSAGIPLDPETLFLVPLPANDSHRLDSALEILEANAKNCRAAPDIQLGLLLTGIRNERHRQPLLQAAASALAEIESRADSRLRLFLQTRPGLPAADAARIGDLLWIPLHKIRPPAWFRQTAGYWRHPLNKLRLRDSRPGTIRPARTESTGSFASHPTR